MSKSTIFLNFQDTRAYKIHLRRPGDPICPLTLTADSAHLPWEASQALTRLRMPQRSVKLTKSRQVQDRLQYRQLEELRSDLAQLQHIVAVAGLQRQLE